MDPKILENRLCDWSRQLGFTLPDGNFPQSTLFSLLVATPNTFHLWEKILTKVQPRDKVEKIRKQILVAKLKSDEKHESQQDPVLNVQNVGIQRKVELWKRKKALEKMINEKRNEVDQLRDEIHKKAQLIQSESCKLSEIEKTRSNLKEKLLISNLLIDKQKKYVENYEEQILKIKSHRKENSGDCFDKRKIWEIVETIQGTMKEKLEKNGYKLDGNDLNDFSELISSKNSLSIIWDLLLDIKDENSKVFSEVVDELQSEIEDDKRDEKNRICWKSLEEKFMLDITENSLQTILNRKMEKSENSKLREIISNIEKLMFNKSIASSSQVDVSYLQPNETGDSLTGRREKMSKLIKALSIHGLKNRKEFLKREIEKIANENNKNDHWTMKKEEYENEFLTSFQKLESAKEKAMEMTTIQKSCVQSVFKIHNELALLMSDLNNDFNKRNLFEKILLFVAGIKKGSENLIQLFDEMCLDAFRKIQISPRKEVFAHECLQHCLDDYGGELRDFFSSLLVSPYEKPQVILSQLEERKNFLSYVSETIAKFESDFGNGQAHFGEGKIAVDKAETMDRNYKETLRVLSKVITRLETLKTEVDLVQDILKSWLKQPYRFMIPDTITVNSMALRQFEEKYRTVQSEIKYCNRIA